MRNKKIKSYLYGLRRGAPIFAGFLPVAISFAIGAMNCGMNPYETVGMSAAVFAGASQLMAVEMISAGSQAIAIIFATLVLNLRHIIMSTCVFRGFKSKNPLIKILSAFGVTDETFALYTTEAEDKRDGYFMLGLVSSTYLSWVMGTVIGVVIQTALPVGISSSFGIALYALFIALIVPDVKKSLGLFITVAFTALLNAVLVCFIDKSWAMVISTLSGAGVGVLLIELGPFSMGPKEKKEGDV